MWLRVLTSRKTAIYNDGDNIIIIIIGVLGLSWFCVGYVGITLVALVFRWLRWYFVGIYPLAKCWWKINVDGGEERSR